jgi:hypothetical protein
MHDSKILLNLKKNLQNYIKFLNYTHKRIKKNSEIIDNGNVSSQEQKKTGSKKQKTDFFEKTNTLKIKT